MKIFYTDGSQDNTFTYNQLVLDINKSEFCYPSRPYQCTYQLLVNFFVCLLSGRSVHFHELGATDFELEYTETEAEGFGQYYPATFEHLAGPDGLFQRLNEVNQDWRLYMYTSGTSGSAKKIGVSWKQLTRDIRRGEKYTHHKWALAYNSTHYAGLQVILQAFLNQNLLLDLFAQDGNRFFDVVTQYEITHISATPTFYRRVFGTNAQVYSGLVSATLGGEASDSVLLQEMGQKLPGAKIRNVYASTEAGTLFGSSGDKFIISEKLIGLVRISETNELLIHHSLLADVPDLILIDGWYHTGDIVEFHGQNQFCFVGRTSAMINVGGYKVNPVEVEAAIRQVGGVRDVLVRGRKNKITGNIVVADLVIDESTTRAELKKSVLTHLKTVLQDWKIPKLFYFVENVSETRTGKLARS